MKGYAYRIWIAVIVVTHCACAPSRIRLGDELANAGPVKDVVKIEVQGWGHPGWPSADPVPITDKLVVSDFYNAIAYGTPESIQDEPSDQTNSCTFFFANGKQVRCSFGLNESTRGMYGPELLDAMKKHAPNKAKSAP